VFLRRPATWKGFPGWYSRIATGQHYATKARCLSRGLARLGYEEGRNLIVESRFADGVYDRLPVLAGELARLKVDVFLAPREPVLLAAKEKGENIPIVVVTCDPIEKLLGSLRRPGGNATGFSCVSADLVGKRFSLLKSLLPQTERVAVLYNKRDNHELEFKDAHAAAPSLGIGLVHFPVGSPDDFEPAFKRMVEEKLDAVYIVASTFANAHWEKLAQLALDYRLPAMYGFREFGTSVASYPMEPTCPTVIDAQQPSSTRFSRDRGRRICRWSNRPASSWSSTREQPKRLASMCRPRYARWPTR
jgi:ABC transporter substrate binding protein